MLVTLWLKNEFAHALVDYGRCPGAIHDGAGEVFHVTNFTFSKILVLMLRFTLDVLDLVETENVADTGTNLDFGIVGEEAIASTMFADEVLKSGSHFGLAAHRVDNILGAFFANVELDHSTTCMAKDAIIVGRSVTEEGVGGNVLIPTVDVVGRKTRAEVLPEWKTSRSTGKLSGMLYGGLDAIKRHPTEVGTEKFQIGLADGDGAFLDDDFTTAFSEYQVDIVVEVTSILPSVRSTRIKI